MESKLTWAFLSHMLDTLHYMMVVGYSGLSASFMMILFIFHLMNTEKIVESSSKCSSSLPSGKETQLWKMFIYIVELLIYILNMVMLNSFTTN